MFGNEKCLTTESRVSQRNKGYFWMFGTEICYIRFGHEVLILKQKARHTELKYLLVLRKMLILRMRNSFIFGKKIRMRAYFFSLLRNESLKFCITN